MVDFRKKLFHIIRLRIIYTRGIITINIIENEKPSIDLWAIAEQPEQNFDVLFPYYRRLAKK